MTFFSYILSDFYKKHKLALNPTLNKHGDRIYLQPDISSTFQYTYVSWQFRYIPTNIFSFIVNRLRMLSPPHFTANKQDLE